jgi:hypothetical protein
MATTLYPYYPPKSVDKIMHSSSRGMSVKCMLIAITINTKKNKIKQKEIVLKINQ